eukprot:13650609-Alexandrium_andersonii.AAC.1
MPGASHQAVRIKMCPEPDTAFSAMWAAPSGGIRTPRIERLCALSASPLGTRGAARSLTHNGACAMAH